MCLGQYKSLGEYCGPHTASEVFLVCTCVCACVCVCRCVCVCVDSYMPGSESTKPCYSMLKTYVGPSFRTTTRYQLQMSLWDRSLYTCGLPMKLIPCVNCVVFFSDGCEDKKCDHYAICESDGKGSSRCVCPASCIQVRHQLDALMHSSYVLYIIIPQGR